jgi:membrane protein implicated in regulation of membrane protease activity
MDWLSPELIWFVIGFILILMEFALPGLITIFFGIGAWIVALICLFLNIPLTPQLLIFIIGSVLPLIFLRNRFKSILAGRSITEPEVNVNELEEFLGKKGVVTEQISPEKKGRIEFRGSTWTAEAYETIPVGASVEIVDKNNITLVVKSI